MNENLKLSPPYVIHYNKLVALFGEDPDFEISPIDDETRSCTISTENRLKYMLLEKNLYSADVDDKQLGLHINLEYTGADRMGANELAALLSTNPHFHSLYEAKEGPFQFSSVVFKKEVLQFYNDNIFDPYIHASVLAQDMVKDLFTSRCYCSTANE